jgi:hypothetical protein
MSFVVIPPVREVEIIASGHGIRDLKRLRRAYGGANWRKLKGIAMIQFAGGDTVLAEIHWIEAHGVGRREVKIKRLIDG